MNRIQNIEHEIKKLTSDELRAFRAWFIKHDSEIWDEQIENDIISGKLDKLARIPYWHTKKEGQNKFEALRFSHLLGVL